MKSWHQVLLGYIEEEREIKARIEAVAALKNRLRSAHRRRIKIEENAKVVASVWGEECTGTGIQFLRISSFSFKSSWFNSSYYSESS